MYKLGLFILMNLVLSSLFAQNQPNIIYILADDMGYGDVTSFNSESKIATPNLDKMAAEGMKFTDAHTNSSVCSPTRYGIITGRYAWRTEMKQGVLNGSSKLLIDPSRATVAGYLKDKGYATACIGKWHLGMNWVTLDGKDPKGNNSNVDLKKEYTLGPKDVGFDYFFGTTASLNMNPHAFIEQGKMIGDLVFAKDLAALESYGIKGDKPGHVDKDFKEDMVMKTLTDKTIEWIDKEHKKDASKPFFVYLPFTAPHSPIVPSKEFIGKSKLNEHGDFCEEVDFRVGEILKKLDELGISDNTIVIFTADNGTSPQAHIKEMEDKGHFSSYTFRGLKGSIYDAGHRVPFIVKWPKTIKKGTSSDRLICTTDFFATIADINNEKLPDTVAEDSFSFFSLLKGENETDEIRGGIVHHSDKGYFSIREGKWKLIFTGDAGSNRNDPKDKPIIGNPAPIQLFDMEKDAGESTNVQAQNPAVVLRLSKLMNQYVKDGRSTKGIPQKNDAYNGKWEQINLFKEY